MKGRGTESEEVIKGRLNTAKIETKRINEADFFNYKVYNDELDKAVSEIEEKLKELYPNLQ